jgi:hypothetical protein
MFPVVYNNGNQIVQASGLVVLRNEMTHETESFRSTAGLTSPSRSDRIWAIDWRGRWDGNTLVVTTTNLNGQTGARGNGNILPLSAEAALTERFTRVAVGTIQYDVTVTTRRHGRVRGRPRFRFNGIPGTRCSRTLVTRETTDDRHPLRVSGRGTCKGKVKKISRF